MKQRIYRYIAIALGVLAVLSTIGEIRLGQIPIVAVFLFAGAKAFYDSSVGKVTDGNHDNRPGFTALSPWEHDNGPNSQLDLLCRERSDTYPLS